SASRQAHTNHAPEGAARPPTRTAPARGSRCGRRRTGAAIDHRCEPIERCRLFNRPAAIVTVTRLAHVVMLAFGWRRALIAFMAGAASALAMAPVNAWPILFVTLPVLVWLIDGSASGRWSAPLTAALAGWCFGFGYFVAGLYWVGYAFLVDA